MPGLERLIYLGGLGELDDPRLSEHLRSRLEVARILQSGPVPATVLRAAMILGSGSASFEIMRYLVDRLPVMIAPRWVHNPVQPIAIRNVLAYLIGCLEVEAVKGQTFDIGGPEVVTYRRLFDLYATEAHLAPAPHHSGARLAPKLSSYSIHLVTPVPASLAQPLAEGFATPVGCRTNRIRFPDSPRDFGLPQHYPSGPATDRAAAGGNLLERRRPYHSAGIGPDPTTNFPGGTILSLGYRLRLHAGPPELWEQITRVGGATGWYFGNFLWKLRGLMDRLVGGVGVQRGRRQPQKLQVGDALDLFRVLEMEPDRRLLLLAEMKLPGEAPLEFRLAPRCEGETELTMVARFLPRGLGGLAYWYALEPFHRRIYQGMLLTIAAAAGKSITAGPERLGR